MKSSEKTTYTKSNHSQPPRATGGTFFPAEDPSDFWWWSPTIGTSGGEGGVCGLGSVGGGGVAGHPVVGGGGGICCSREGHRTSSGLPSDCWRCGGGGGALLCLFASAVFWCLGASSPTKEPSPRWSLWVLDPSILSLCRCSGTGTFSFPFPAGAGPPGLGPRDLGWRAAGGRVRHRGCGSCDWGTSQVPDRQAALVEGRH
jgi:hypothetical protein